MTVANGGARDLRGEVEAIPGRFERLDDVPLAVDVLAHRGIGIAGPLHATRALARSLVVQAATMHSPTDLAVLALVGEGGLNHWGFLKWLPHARTLGGSQLASTSHHALTIVNDLLAGRPAGAARRCPAVLVVIDETCPVERRRLMPLLEAGAASRHRLRVGLVGPPPPAQGVRRRRRDRP